MISKGLKKIMAVGLSLAMVASVAPAIGVEKTTVSAKNWVNTEIKITTGTSGSFAEASGLYTSYDEDAAVCTSGSIVAYANGKAGKTCTVYTAMTPQYQYTKDSKGKIKSSMTKIVVAVTKSDALPTVANSKITVAADDKKIATAKIKNGEITVTAGKEGGKGYLWVLEVTGKDKYIKYKNGQGEGERQELTATESNKIYDCYDNGFIRIPVNIKAAPTGTQLSATDVGDKVPDTSFTKGEVQVGNSQDIYLYPYVKSGSSKVGAYDGVTYTPQIKDAEKSYVSVEKDANDPLHFIVTAKALKEDGKKVTSTVTFVNDQNGKKASFKITNIAKVDRIDLTAPTTVTAKTQKELDKITVYDMTRTTTASAVTAEFTTVVTVSNGVVGVATTKPTKTTDTIKVMKITQDNATKIANSGITFDAKGKLKDITEDKTNTKVSVSISLKDNKLKFKTNSKCPAGSQYFLIYSNTGYAKVVKVNF